VSFDVLLCAECAASCTTCYYDSNGNNLCAECLVGYVVTFDGQSCERMSDIVTLRNNHYKRLRYF